MKCCVESCKNEGTIQQITIFEEVEMYCQSCFYEIGNQVKRIERRSEDIIFRHGTMRCGKTLSLITTHTSLTKNGKTVAIVKPAMDTRSAKGKVVSRGTRTRLECLLLDEKTCEDIDIPQVDYILVDEAQFLTKKMVEVLYQWSRTHGAELIFYGLMRDFNGRLFEGTIEVLAIASKIEEFVSHCETVGCRSQATHHLLFDGGKVVYGEGDGLKIGDEEYRSVCYTHFRNTVDAHLC